MRRGVTGSSAPNLTAGKKLGRYTIIEPLGAGGMGTVYRALDDKLERVVAIKILSPGVLSRRGIRGGDFARKHWHWQSSAMLPSHRSMTLGNRMASTTL